MHDRHGIGKGNVEKRRLLRFCDEKELCEANTWFKKQRKIAYSMGGNEIEIDFVLVDKNNRKYLKEVRAIRSFKYFLLFLSITFVYVVIRRLFHLTSISI